MFKQYEEGVFFSGKVVGYIKNLGFIYIIASIASWFEVHNNGWSVKIGPTELLIGIIIVLIGWVMDEARKLKEEQEFTV